MNCKLNHSPAGDAPTGKFSKYIITFLHLEYQYICVLQWKLRDFLIQLPALTVFETEIQKSNQGNIRNRNSNCPLCFFGCDVYDFDTAVSFKNLRSPQCSIKAYTVLWMLRVLWLVVALDPLESAKICGLREWRTWKKLSSCIRYLFMPL